MFDPGKSKVVEDESTGMCSPTLWAKSSPPQHHHKNNYRSLSPESKIQAIERGQRELMEMVRNMPESCYELTLKDLVVEREKPKNEEIKERNLHLSNKKREGVCNSNSRKVDKRSNGNIDSGGFYLKMVFPISLGSKNNKKKKKESLANNSSKVSDKEWWKKKSESNNGGSSIKSYGSSSSHSSRSNSRHEMSGSSCWPFLRRFLSWAAAGSLDPDDTWTLSINNQKVQKELKYSGGKPRRMLLEKREEVTDGP